jgi:hypothetical protein
VYGDFFLHTPCEEQTSSLPIALPVVSSISQGVPALLTGRVTCSQSKMNWGIVRLSGIGGRGPEIEEISMVLKVERQLR